MLTTEKIIGMMKYFADKGTEENNYYRIVIHYSGEDADVILLVPERLEFIDKYTNQDTTLIFGHTKRGRDRRYYIDLDKISRITIENGWGDYE